MSAPFNSLSPAEAERLAMLAEEAGEIVQAVGKVLRHGYESRHPDGGWTNREWLEKEVADLQAVAHGMAHASDITLLHEEPFVWACKQRYTHHQNDADGAA